MKLELGMYCRTEDGYIFKYSKENNIYFDEINNTYYVLIDNGEYDDCDVIKKIDNNIIDLIEIGDYVNGYQVIEKPYNYRDIKFISVDTQDSWSWGKGEMPCTEIKTILTKEQFENNCFKIVN